MQLTLCIWDFVQLQPNAANGNNARKSYLTAVREGIYEGKAIRPVEWLRAATTCLWWHTSTGTVVHIYRYTYTSPQLNNEHERNHTTN
jgi:hypothetical protein